MRVIQGCAVLLSCVVMAGCGGSSAGEQFESATPEPKPEPTKPDDKDTKKPKPFSLTTTSVNDLPKCETAIQGALAYTTVDKAFLACADGKWTKIDAKGEKGDKGDAGDASPASTHKTKFSIFCTGEIGTTSLYFSYSALEFSNGDVWVSAQIKDAADGIANSAFYAAAQNGAATAPVIVSADRLGTANAGYWRFELPRDTLVLALVYSDADASGGSDSWSMPVSACQKSSY